MPELDITGGADRRRRADLRHRHRRERRSSRRCRSSACEAQLYPVDVQCRQWRAAADARRHPCRRHRGQGARQITTEIVRELVDDIVLVSEDQIERAVATLISIEKTVVEGAGAAGLAAVLAAPERFAGLQCRPGADRRQYRHQADRLGPDPRARARGTADLQLALDIVDRPGQLAAVSILLADAGANIIEVSHQRTFSDLPAKATLLELVIETRDRAHLEAGAGQARWSSRTGGVFSRCSGASPGRASGVILEYRRCAAAAPGRAFELTSFWPSPAANSASFAMVLILRAVPLAAAAIFSFERPMPLPKAT